jgi:hypothetical protein
LGIEALLVNALVEATSPGSRALGELLDVAARAKSATGPGQDHASHIGCGLDVVKGASETDLHLSRERVAALGAVHHKRRHPGSDAGE